MHLFCVTWSLNLRRHNQKEVLSVQYMKVCKWGAKKRSCQCRNLKREFTLLSITLKAVDLPERLSYKIYPRYFTFECCLISIPLYTMFKDLACQSLWQVTNNTDSVLSCPKCICRRSIPEPRFFAKETSTSTFFWLLQNLGCIGSSLIEKQRHVLERLDVYWDNRWFNCESRLVLTYFEYILYNYTKYTQPPGYSLSVDRTISDIYLIYYQQISHTSLKNL